MRGIKAVFFKEMKCFLGSGKGQFLFYGLLIVSWSLFLAFREQPNEMGGPWWLIFFSVVVTANFSNTVFISERINGALEILITAGFPRRTILIGKMGFIISFSAIMGLLCLVLGTLVRNVFNEGDGALSFFDFLTFVGAVFYNASGAAFLSVRMSNPRLLHLANMLVLTILAIIYSTLSYFHDVPSYTLIVVLFATAFFFTWLATKEFESDRILHPVDF